MPLRPCRQTGCAELVAAGYCPEHKAASDKRWRGTAASRGYDAAWRRFREWFLGRHPLCHDCEREPSTEVHHILKVAEHPELRLEESNCLGLCKSCHSRRTSLGE
jgi:5-methylcytosine-specific restriction protein A